MLGAIDVGGTAIKYGVVSVSATSAEAAIVWQESTPTLAHNGVDAVVTRICRIAETILHRTPQVKRLGIGVPGIVHPTSRRVQSPPNLPGWTSVDLIGALRQSSQIGTSLPIQVENDANCGAIAELRAGHGRGLEHFVYVTLGTGVGGGLVLNGALYTGHMGEAGEIGHMKPVWYEPLADHMAISVHEATKLEDIVGRAGIMRLYGGGHDVMEISRRADGGESKARIVLSTAGHILGSTLASAVAVLGVRTVIIGGGLSNSSVLMDAAEHALRHIPLPTVAESLTVRQAFFQNHAGLIGAALL